jgi:hypothetical protein
VTARAKAAHQSEVAIVAATGNSFLVVARRSNGPKVELLRAERSCA